MGTRRHRSENGYSLIEVLVSVAILATVLIGLIGGMLVTLRSVEANGSGSEAAAALEAVTERVRGVAYRPCTTPGQLAADYAAAPYPITYSATPPTVRFLEVRHWNATTRSFALAGAPCSTDRGIALVRVQVTVGSQTEVGQITYRNPSALPT